MNARIEAIASAFPARRVTNEEWKREFPDWDFVHLEKRTGVLRRWVAGPDETALDFAEAACRKLVDQGRWPAEGPDAIVFCTETPDYAMPPNACVLHGRLGLPAEVMALDITLACSGYVYGLQLARSFIAAGTARRVLLATADTYTRYIHPRDRATRCLFGDGGAVSLIGPSPDGRGIVDVQCATSGRHYEKFIVPAGGMRTARSAGTTVETTDRSGNVRTAEHINMDGFGVLSFFNSVVPPAVRGLLARNRMRLEDVDLFVFHQASQIALDSLRKALAIPEEKMVYDLAETGNLVSASIPVALERALASGRAREGSRALLCGFGVGMSWGVALVDL